MFDNKEPCYTPKVLKRKRGIVITHSIVYVARANEKERERKLDKAYEYLAYTSS